MKLCLIYDTSYGFELLYADNRKTFFRPYNPCWDIESFKEAYGKEMERMFSSAVNRALIEKCI